LQKKVDISSILTSNINITTLKIYKFMAVPTLMYGSKCWAMNKADRRAVEAAEMIFL
jgi:hypothetical protein